VNQETIKTVQDSWGKVTPIAPQAAALFYKNLFEADPALQGLFKGNMKEQGDKLMQMIGIAVSKLDELGALVPALQGLARRHAGYGVQEAHYQTVGASLLKTLEQGLGADFTLEVKSACAARSGRHVECRLQRRRCRRMYLFDHRRSCRRRWWKVPCDAR
jgi:hemoglobin-like flavoprotein